MKLTLAVFFLSISPQLLSNESGPVIYSTFDSALIGGQAVVDGDYTEVVRITDLKSWCTGSLIGPEVLLTAAHCTEPGGYVNFQSKGLVYSAQCRLAPDYTSSVGDQDMALCKLESAHPGPYASVATKGPSLLSHVRLIGYGCTKAGGGGGNDGVLRVGISMVVKVPTDTYYSFHTRGNVALCYGDSGGPAFVADQASHHTVLGVNSRGNIRDTSLMTAVYHPNSVQFMKDFENEEQVKICGIGAACGFTDLDDSSICQ